MVAKPNIGAEPPDRMIGGFFFHFLLDGFLQKILMSKSVVVFKMATRRKTVISSTFFGKRKSGLRQGRSGAIFLHFHPEYVTINLLGKKFLKNFQFFQKS